MRGLVINGVGEAVERPASEAPVGDSRAVAVDDGLCPAASRSRYRRVPWLQYQRSRSAPLESAWRRPTAPIALRGAG